MRWSLILGCHDEKRVVVGFARIPEPNDEQGRPAGTERDLVAYLPVRNG